MGEYADDQFRRDVESRFGFDPGSMYSDNKPKTKPQKVPCKKCGRHIKPVGLRDHMRDVHGITEDSK